MKFLLGFFLVFIISWILAFIPEVMKIHGVSSHYVDSCFYFVGVITGIIVGVITGIIGTNFFRIRSS
jgi:hypothetical protein